MMLHFVFWDKASESSGRAERSTRGTYREITERENKTAPFKRPSSHKTDGNRIQNVIKQAQNLIAFC